jgi:hypothetical protein
MRISQMKIREDFDRILVDTLSRGWSEQFGARIRVSLGADEPGQHWALHPLLSAYCTHDANAQVRDFLRKSFRFTPVLWRLLPQWLLGTAMTTSAGMNLGARSGFHVRPAIDQASAMAVIPGNQRIRVFDFSRDRVRTLLKAGFDDDALRAEIEVRTQREGPFPAIVAHAGDCSWFEEPIMEGYDLVRCPPWFPKKTLFRRALDLLEAWSLRETREVDASTYVEDLICQLEEATDGVCERFEFDRRRQLLETVEVLGDLASRADTFVLSNTHGDWQPGNIRVDLQADQIWILDWEHAGMRSRYYDRLVYGLQTRSGLGLAGRLMEFVSAANDQWLFAPMYSEPSWRCIRLCLFLLEDLLWFLSESLAGPTLKVSQGLTIYLDELDSLGPQLAQLREPVECASH